MTAGDRAHDPFDELAVGWALHALEPEDETSFLAHLAGCGRCTTTVDETREVMAAMATDLTPAEPSADLRDRIRTAVGRTDQLPGPMPRPAVLPESTTGPLRRHPGGVRESRPAVRSRSRSRWRRAVPMGLAAAGVAGIVGLGLWNVVLTSQQQQLQATVAEQHKVMDSLLAPGGATVSPLEEDGKAVATVVVRGDEVDLITYGLPVNDRSTSTYVLWGMGDNIAQPLGEFDVSSSQMDMLTVGSGVTGFDRFATYGVSLEPGRKAPPLPTEVVATGQVTS